MATALQLFEKAEPLRPQGNDDALSAGTRAFAS